MTSAHADDDRPGGHQVDFSISESQAVANDRLTVTFNRVAEGTSPQEVANEINRAMQAAIRAVKSDPKIITQTTQYRIHPVYKKSVLSHWRGQQSLTVILENRLDFAKVLNKVQPYLAYQSMQFSVSEDLRQNTLVTLTDRAIQRYRAQADRIAQGFQAPTYRILNTRIHAQPPSSPRPYAARAEMAVASASMAVPTVQAGESQLRVTISGNILLPE